MSIPGSTNPLLLFGDPTGGQYQIQRSLRFNASDSAFCSRTPAVAGNRKTWTWAGWVKRSYLNSSGATYQQLFTAGSSGVVRDVFFFDTDTDDTLAFYSIGSGFGAGTLLFRTNAVFRDVSAWYHIVLAVDTTQATAANRIRLYVNGVEQTFSTANYPSQNSDGLINSVIGHGIGRDQGQANQYFDGYLAECFLIDGQQLTPSSFTEVSATTGQLIPKAYGGTFGTNGFWLKFSDNSAATAATLGKDYSGNSNNWTPNNLSVTAGAGNDSLVDTPTSFGTDTGVGGEVRGNYCCINPNDKNNGASVDLKDGNLEYVVSAAGQHGCRRSTFALSSSKWYAECTIKVATGGTDRIGILSASQADFVTNSNPSLGFFSQGYAYMSNGQKENNNVSVSYGASYTTNDVIGIALDMDAGTVTFYKNGSSQGQAYSGLSGAFCFAGSPFNGGTHVWNFGQRAFAYTAPSGFKALCDTNLPAPLTAKPNTLMDVITYTGDGTTPRTISGLAFSPDFVWSKSRNQSYGHNLWDVIRGGGLTLRSDNTGADVANNPHGYLSAFTSTGYTVINGTDPAGNLNTNETNTTYVAWTWDAGTSTVTNTAGSITSQVRANASAGFSIVTWTTTSSAGTVGHGLNITPSIVLFKRRDSAQDWYFETNIIDGSYDYLVLNSTAAKVDGGSSWSTRATSTTITSFTGTAGLTYVAYCFAPVVGYSSMGSYTGNGSTDGPFVYTGFRPRWIMVKSTGSAENWFLLDTARNTYNAVNSYLMPNSSSAEDANNSTVNTDFLSNGFKLRATTSALNTNAIIYIYAAFAENPFQYARAR